MDPPRQFAVHLLNLDVVSKPLWILQVLKQRFPGTLLVSDICSLAALPQASWQSCFPQDTVRSLQLTLLILPSLQH